MTRQSLITQTKLSLSNIPPLGWIIGSVLAVGVLYSLIFFIPKPVTFSYAERTCVTQFVGFPDIQRTHADGFKVELEGIVQIGKVALYSTKVCFEPSETPQPGNMTASIAPFGGLFARKQITIQIPEAPVARASDIVGKTISTARPLTIQLTAPDVIHQYELRVADKSAACKQVDASLSCDVAALGLAHGTAYTAALYQTYKQADKKVVEGKIETLQPLILATASITDGQVIYDAPTSATFTFDQPISEGGVSLVKVNGETTEPVATTVTRDGSVATMTFEPLARESQYRVLITDSLGENGSSLASPVTLNFTTSGGPKPNNVSVGSHSVARNATITVTFDQPLAADIDIAALARVEGVNASVRKKSDTQITFTIQGGDCSAFTLVVDKGVKSGSNGELSKDAWRFNSRTICGYSWVIGTSVQGRPIVAYSFGSGSKTVLFTGGMHGSEPSGYTTMLAWAQHLQAYGDIVPSDKRVVIVPNTNPDATAANSRNNSRDVNIARNFPTANWQSSIETTRGTLPYGGGTSAGSEPEAAALIALTRQLKPRLEVSFHAQGRLVGANKYADSVGIGQTYANIVKYKTMFHNAEEVMGYAMTGEYEDWMGEEMNIPAILIELPSASGNYLSSQLTALKKMLTV